MQYILKPCLLQAKADHVIYLALEETLLYGAELNPVYHPSLSPHPATATYQPTVDNVSFYISQMLLILSFFTTESYDQAVCALTPMSLCCAFFITMG